MSARFEWVGVGMDGITRSPGQPTPLVHQLQTYLLQANPGEVLPASDVWSEIQQRIVGLLGSMVTLLPGAIAAVVIFFLTRSLSTVAQRLASSAAERTLRSPSLRSLVEQSSRALVWGIGILAAAVVLFPGLSVGDLIGLLGLGSVAISFAFQDIFKNFLAGILLLLQEPFQIGDQIVVEGYEGSVEKIAVRSTQIRTYQGERVVIPNSILFVNPVRVLTAEPSRRTDLEIGVDYNTPLPFAVETFKTAIATVEGVLATPMPEVDVVGFGDSSIDLKVRYWTMPEVAQVRRIQSRAAIALKQACDRHDITIPYPIRTVYHYDQHDFSDNDPNN